MHLCVKETNVFTNNGPFDSKDGDNNIILLINVINIYSLSKLCVFLIENVFQVSDMAHAVGKSVRPAKGRLGVRIPATTDLSR